MTFNFQEAWTEAAVFVSCIILRFIMFVYFPSSIPKCNYSYQWVYVTFLAIVIDWGIFLQRGLGYVWVPFFVETLDHFSFQCRKKWCFICCSICPNIPNWIIIPVFDVSCMPSCWCCWRHACLNRFQHSQCLFWDCVISIFRSISLYLPSWLPYFLCTVDTVLTVSPYTVRFGVLLLTHQ